MSSPFHHPLQMVRDEQPTPKRPAATLQQRKASWNVLRGRDAAVSTPYVKNSSRRRESEGGAQRNSTLVDNVTTGV